VTPIRFLTGLVFLALLGGCAERSTEEGAAPGTGAAPAVVAATTAAEAEVSAKGQTVVVAGVVDGDTIELRSGRRVRLVQIDAPEGDQGECYADEATDALRAILPKGTSVRLEADPRLDQLDGYGRLLRYVVKGEQNVNLLLVRRGAATVWFYHGDRGAYATALLRGAQRARAAGRGLWGACPGTPFDPLHAASTGTAEAPPPSTPVTCAGAISWRDAASHVGEEATVQGPVVGTFFAAGSNGQPTFLNLGRDYPDPARVTVLIWGADRAKFPGPPEDLYAGRTICVTGTIETYQGVPEIEASSPGQIAIAG